MRATTALRRELKTRFFPAAREAGFTIDEREAPTFWIFRRTVGESVHIFSLQWEKYGYPRFRIDLGTCPTAGLTLDGKHVPHADMHPHWLPDASSLTPGRGSSSRSWFRQDRTFLRRLFGGSPLRPPGEVVDELLRLFEEAELYWGQGTVGAHLRRWRRDEA